jgi:hypothetical protein
MVCKLEPTNKFAREKYQETLKEHRYRQFASTIVYDEKRIEVNLDDIPVEPSYTGPTLDKIEDITPKWVETLLEYMKD